MGLDVTIGVLVLLAGIRGWIKGFLIQAIHLTALVSSVFLAAPVRDLARPYVKDHFPALQPELLDRLMWWVGAVLVYIVLSGIPSSLVRLYRRRPAAEVDSRWGDYGAGFVLGTAKGLITVAFLLWGLERYALPQLEQLPGAATVANADAATGPLALPGLAQDPGWITGQVQTSHIFPLVRTYRPAERIWASEPVQMIVQRVKTQGLGSTTVTDPKIETEEPPPVSARRPSTTVPAVLPRPTLSLPRQVPPSDPKSPRFLDELDATLKHDGVVKSR